MFGIKREDEEKKQQVVLNKEKLDECYAKLSPSHSVYMLFRNDRIRFEDTDLEIFKKACGKGQRQVVEVLLNRVDPTADRNLAFLLATKNGHVEIVRLLLNDGKVDPRARGNFAFQLAAEDRQVEIVRLLLEDGRVDPTAYSNYAFRWAAENEHYKVVELLLKDSRIKKSENFPRLAAKKAYLKADKYNHTDAAALLVSAAGVRFTESEFEDIKGYQRYKQILDNYQSKMSKTLLDSTSLSEDLSKYTSI